MQRDRTVLDASLVTIDAEIASRQAELQVLKDGVGETRAALQRTIGEMEQASRRIDETKGDMRREAAQAENALPEHVKRTETMLLEEIGQLREFTAGRRTRNQLPFVLGPNEDPHRRILDAIDQLGRIRKNSYPRFQNTAGAQTLKRNLDNQLASYSSLSAEADRLYTARTRSEDDLVGKNLMLDTMTQERANLRLARETRKPSAKSVLLVGQRGRFFQAGDEIDPEILAAYREFLAYSREIVDRARRDRDSARTIMREADGQRQEFQRMFITTGNEVVALGNRISGLIMKNAFFRAGLEVAEVVYAARKGGVAGAAAEKAPAVSRAILSVPAFP